MLALDLSHRLVAGSEKIVVKCKYFFVGSISNALHCSWALCSLS